jgi:LmbE family N-acetylglucosaminyl deacetylase
VLPSSRERLLVVSPHLDDGILSLGAYLAERAARGAEVKVLTIFAGDPSSTAPAGRWDARAGFATAGDAARHRRDEDRAACAIVGAECAWMPFFDKDYGPSPADDAVWERLSTHVAAADAVFVPGRPLIHPDHAWASSLTTAFADPAKIVFYAELPYDVWPDDKRSGARVAEPAGDRVWTAPRASLRTRRLKWRATGAYSTQLPWLARRGYRTSVLRSRLGRERLAWPSN